jgi:hypothetical protein
MTKTELRRLFPEARIVPERVGPWVKSWYVIYDGVSTSNEHQRVTSFGTREH